MSEHDPHDTPEAKTEEGDAPAPDHVQGPVGAVNDGQPKPRAIVGIGASAGGLAALRTLFSRIPADTGIAYVVVVHLSPEHESHLEQLLQAHASIPIRQVTKEERLEPDHGYVIPPNRNISAVDTHVRLTELEAERRDRWPIDHFLRTLADHGDAQPIAVILTGTGSDGTLGLRKIKERGGITIVQDPAEAEYDAMPRSAIATGDVDVIVPVADIPGKILALIRVLPEVAPGDERAQLDQEKERRVQEVLALVRDRTGRDFTRYKRTTILRRLQRRLQLKQMADLASYLETLHGDPREAHALADEFLVSVTEFFRDPAVFETLERDVVPRLLEGKGPADRVRVWSVGCATGEEAYSVAMLLSERIRHKGIGPTVQIFASDVDARALETARTGTYPETIESGVSRERLDRFFVEDNGGYRVRKELRELVVFTPHDLLSDPPFSRIDLVVCRNVLIYLQREVQREVLSLFHYSLQTDGFLLLGTSESMDRAELFGAVDKAACLYRKRDAPRSATTLSVFPLSYSLSPAVEGSPEPARGTPSYGALHQEMVERYALPSILLDPDHQIVHVSQSAGRYLHVQGGTLSSNVLGLIRDELRIELRTALHAATETGAPVRSRAVELTVDGREALATLDVRPATEDGRRDFVLVFFDERPALDDADTTWPAAEATDRDLGAELELTKHRLQVAIEEHETAQEEMKASNEELQSMNEELRSSLEELETSKEELQSVNEELATVNQEHQHKVMELAQMAGDLQNLLASTDIATLFLGRDLRILRFTPKVTELFNVRVSDRGRPLSDFTHRLGAATLDDDARKVLETLVPIEREVQSEDRRWHLTRVRPYRSSEDRIEGVVLTFVDITERKRAEDAMRDAQEAREIALDAARMGTWFIDLATMRTETDLRHDRIFGYPQGLEDWSPDRFRELIVPEDRPVFDAAFDRAMAEGAVDLEVRVVRPDGTVRWIQFRGEVRLDDDGEAHHIAGVTRDTTEAKEAEDALRRLNETLEERVRERTRQVQQLAANLSMAEQRERARIAQVLHDDVQQLLHSLQVKVKMLAAAQDDDKVRAFASEADEVLRQALRATRSLTVEINPPVLRDEGLGAALRWLAAYMRDSYALAVELDLALDGEALLAEGKRVMLFHSMRELLFNVVKHAQSDRATVTARLRDGMVEVEVADEGVGFDPAEAADAQGRGFGTANMQERLQLSGGGMDIDTAPGEGVRVVLRLPVDG